MNLVKKAYYKFVDNLIFVPGQWMIVLFMLLLFGWYPLYYKHGYVGIDEAKNSFLLFICKYGACMMCLGIIIQMFMKRIPSQAKLKLSITDVAVLLYALVTAISTVTAIDRQTAIHGQSGWFMGALLIELLCFIYFIITRIYLGDIVTVPVILLTSFIVFSLGFLNRFGIWPLPIEVPYQFSYISTMGNIGWYSGYISVIAPLGIGLYLFTPRLSLRKRVILLMYTMIVFLTGLSQGGDSIFLFFGAVFALAFACVTLYSDSLARALELLMLWCASGQVIHLIRMIWPDSYGYDSDNICGRFNNSYLSLGLLIGVAFIYVLIKKCSSNAKDVKCSSNAKDVKCSSNAKDVKCSSNAKDVKCSSNAFNVIRKVVSRLAITVCILAVAAFIAFISHNSSKIVGGENDWGGGRGTTINVGITMWKQQPVLRKLIGIGPDCFAICSYYDEELNAIITERFGDRLLANAHNEAITNMVDIGVLGTVAFYLIAIGFCVRCRKYWKKDVRLLCILMCILGYHAYNLLNYAMELNYPFYIILVALGESWVKRIEVSELDTESTFESGIESTLESGIESTLESGIESI